MSTQTERQQEANPIMTVEELAAKINLPVAHVRRMMVEAGRHRHKLTYLWVGDGVFAKCSTCDFEDKVPWNLEDQDDLRLLFHGPNG